MFPTTLSPDLLVGGGGGSPAALCPADKDNVHDKGNISRTKAIPCFIAERKPPATQESQARSRGMDFPDCGLEGQHWLVAQWGE